MMVEKAKKIMVFAAHPDDEIIGCGGSIAKYVDSGKNVEIAYMTSSNDGEKNSREEEARCATDILGVHDIFFFREPDRDVSYNKKILNRVIRLLRNRRPDMVFSPHPEEGDRDHRATYEIVNEATWLASSPYFPYLGRSYNISSLLFYEVWTPLRDFQLVEDVTGFMDRKMNALQQYQSQLSTVRYDDAIRGLNRYRGIMTGVGGYAEVFGIKFLKKSLVTM